MLLTHHGNGHGVRLQDIASKLTHPGCPLPAQPFGSTKSGLQPEAKTREVAARLAQSAEHKALNLVVVGSSPRWVFAWVCPACHHQGHWQGLLEATPRRFEPHNWQVCFQIRSHFHSPSVPLCIGPWFTVRLSIVPWSLCPLSKYTATQLTRPLRRRFEKLEFCVCAKILVDSRTWR